MSRSIDYYFSMASPWAYIGHQPFMAIARQHGVTVRFKPVSLANVFAETGGLPLPKRHPARQRYRIVELQRWREKRGLKFSLHPKHWPFDNKLADRFVIAMTMEGHDPDRFLSRAFPAVWAEERNLGDEATLIDIANAAGMPGAELLKTAKSDAAEAIYNKHYEEAVAGDVIGSPCYVLDGEVFWGQDRLDLLNDALASGRSSYRSDV
ncbi:MAG TPA: 2-hydroxychromene-2-carboxylate isomerase [Xanthobacteraceae bacterium]|jgi:2-hydroxychromene-2-carboxylate isomerase|nr:2-hydroxychromene-2-carboxylate isomerase [Xanthobacteraceae bacterium]